jgi:hypothetical protein
MKLLILAACLLIGNSANAQSPEILAEAVQFARAELARQGVGSDEEVVFEMLVAHTALPRAEKARVRQPWSRAHLDMVESSTDMKRGTLESIRKCTTLQSGVRSCTLRPTRALVAATQPQVNGDRATVIVLLRFQPPTLSYSPTTKEPFEIHFLQNIQVELTRRSNGWMVTGHTKGPASVSVDG